MRLGTALLQFFMIALPAVSRGATDPLGGTRQCLVVTSENWSAPTGALRAFERGRSGDWKAVGDSVPVVLGKKGLGWGLGLVRLPASDGPRKKEGDNKATGGIFRLGPAFGYAAADRASWIKLPYVALTNTTDGVDDPRTFSINGVFSLPIIRKQSPELVPASFFTSGETPPLRPPVAPPCQRKIW
jgi:hypothetical protein